ncbi:MAG: glycosyltransferase [Lachnospiraceae bacterium]|nr:glycosyltransferase [Lachnospiraceae bacterium]
MSGMRVAIIGEMPNQVYSGGRYHAWVMAECLLNEENSVMLITNTIPPFASDFEDYPFHKRLKLFLTQSFEDIALIRDEFDWVIAIPGIKTNTKTYRAWYDFSVIKRARFAFINFETPNWYSECGMINRSTLGFEFLHKLCKYGALVFSSAYESDKYARRYYSQYPKSTDFCVWSPAINSKVADTTNATKEKQIITFLREADSHKGSDDFLSILCNQLSGYTVVCIVGTKISSEYLVKIFERAQDCNIKLKIKYHLNDYEKFIEYKKSLVLLFPSHFEGYGYPPVEALYCATRCVCYDLPVLREVSGKYITTCEMDNTQELRKALIEELNKPQINQVIVDTADFDRQAKRIDEILSSHMKNNKIMNRAWNDYCSSFFRLKRDYIFGRCRLLYAKFGLCSMVKKTIESNSVLSKRINEEDESWKKIKKNIKGKKVFIWGYGGGYLSVFPKYINRINIHGIIDASPYKQGLMDIITKKIYVQSPEILKQYSPDEIAVIISSVSFIDEIIETLQNMNIKEIHSLILMETNSIKGKNYRNRIIK